MDQELLVVFKPYSPVRLCNLVKNMELNNQCGVVVPPGCSLSPDVPGCLKVRLECGREVAVKPQNVQLLAVPGVSGVAGQSAGLPIASQEQVLQQVLAHMQAETGAGGQAVLALGGEAGAVTTSVLSPVVPVESPATGPWGLT